MAEEERRAYRMEGDMPLKAEDVPPVFCKGETWRVQDEYGNVYKLNRCPHDIFLKKNGKEHELHLVYSTDMKSELKGQNKTRKDPF